MHDAVYSQLSYKIYTSILFLNQSKNLYFPIEFQIFRYIENISCLIDEMNFKRKNFSYIYISTNLLSGKKHFSKSLL